MANKTQIAARRYTLEEVDALRDAIRESNSYEAVMLNPFTRLPDVHDPITYTQYPSDEFVERHVRTAMMAGIGAAEYEASD